MQPKQGHPVGVSQVSERCMNLVKRLRSADAAKRIDQPWLNKALDAHAKSLRGAVRGQRLFLSFCDCEGLDFSNHDIRGADLCGAILEVTDLRSARRYKP